MKQESTEWSALSGERRAERRRRRGRRRRRSDKREDVLSETLVKVAVLRLK